MHAERVLDYWKNAQEIGVRQKKLLNLVYFVVFSKNSLQGRSVAPVQYINNDCIAV